MVQKTVHLQYISRFDLSVLPYPVFQQFHKLYLPVLALPAFRRSCLFISPRRLSAALSPCITAAGSIPSNFTQPSGRDTYLPPVFDVLSLTQKHIFCHYILPFSPSAGSIRLKNDFIFKIFAPSYEKNTKIRLTNRKFML